MIFYRVIILWSLSLCCLVQYPTLPYTLCLQTDPNGFAAIVESLLDDIFKFATLMPRVASHLNRPDYLQEVDDILELAELREDILRRVDAVINQVRKLNG